MSGQVRNLEQINVSLISGEKRFVYVYDLGRVIEEGESVTGLPSHNPTLVGIGDDMSRLCSSKTGHTIILEGRLTLECDGCDHEFV